MKISNYDEYDYDYSKYWENRGYEDKAERNYLEKVLKNVRGDWFIDIGGSYGRNLDLYYERFKHPVIIDYSLQTLQKNYVEIMERFPNTTLIAANAYFLPFRDNSFDGGLMVRVLHHIENTQRYFKEVSRILTPGSLYIQEFANKLHFKAIVRNKLKLNFSFFNQKPYQQPTHGNFEGTKGESTLFYNFHPKYIKKQMKENGFNIIDRQGVSFLRVPILKKVLGEKILIKTESILQKFFKGIYFTPSIFYTSYKAGTLIPESAETLTDILVCPHCKADLRIESKKAVCTKCMMNFNKEGNIWDFRVQ
ncbi:class I SAM-dependent methyltransferase [Candidatus Dojkabacteria bacterium]|nr:class I SAM-dependent methyltransferase [Candidatus Dojkabacteria bacterium]